MNRRLSKTSLSLHKPIQIKQSLKSIDNQKLPKQNIFDRLLQPLSHNQQKKDNERKYQAKFVKPDYQRLNEQNLELKKTLKRQEENILNLKYKLADCDRRQKHMEGLQEKYLENIQKQYDEIYRKSLKESTEANPQAGKQYKLPVYIEILKNKIKDYSEQQHQLQAQIKELKHLPNSSIFEENDIEKSYLSNEAIRLKSIITSLVVTSTQQNDMESHSIENNFLKIMKEENQKLKSTIRLLQNDKNLLKSRQTIQKKLLNDSKKQIDILKEKLKIKQSEIEKLNSQNKNLLFKKVNQFRIEQEKKENQELEKLQEKIANLEKYNETLEFERDEKNEQYNLLRDEDKEKTFAFNEKENAYLINIEILKEKIDNFDNENHSLKSEIQYLMKNGNNRKNKERLNLLHQNSNEGENKQLRKWGGHGLKNSLKEYSKCVKFEEVQFSLIKIYYKFIQNQETHSLLDCLEQILNSCEERDPLHINKGGEPEIEYKCRELQQILTDEPLFLPKQHAIKLIRYICQNNAAERFTYDQNATVSKSHLLLILKNAIKTLLECQSNSTEEKIRCLLSRGKKLWAELEKRNSESITVSQFVDILVKNTMERVEAQYLTFISLQCLDVQASENELILRVKDIMEAFTSISNGYSLRKSSLT